MPSVWLQIPATLGSEICAKKLNKTNNRAAAWSSSIFLKPISGNQTLELKHSVILSCMSYWGADDEAVWPLPLVEGQPLLLLQGEHDDGQGEDKSFSRTGEGDANHVPAWKTEHIKTCQQQLCDILSKICHIPVVSVCIWVCSCFVFFAPQMIVLKSTRSFNLSVLSLTNTRFVDCLQAVLFIIFNSLFGGWRQDQFIQCQ